jgi:single-stranded-DNA-specific exonuclease
MKRPYQPKRWQILPGDIQAETQIMMEVGTHPTVARLLVQRGITTPEAAYNFLNPSLDRLHDPFLLPDAEKACVRLKQALADKERILIHGDYDGDGVTSAALWTRFLRSLGAEVDVFVPHRQRDGYDMRMPIIEQARQQGVTLIITTDCGIQRVEEVDAARDAGIDVIVTDHHTPRTSGELPNAVAVVNPHRRDSRYPFPNLAGVGVAFKVCEALTRYLGHKVDRFRRGFLDLTALGTVTDVMPLIDENRILVKNGLEALQNTRKPGLQALIKVSGYDQKPIDSYAIGFGLGPRLNAASRVDETQIALDLLLTKDPDAAHTLARRLNELNITRREVTRQMFEEALEQVARQDVSEAHCLVVSNPGWPGGMVGLVASDIVKRFHRPCIVISINEQTGEGRGSARSIHAFNIFEAIDTCRDLLNEYGGHAHAAGMALAQEHIPDFAAQMNRLAASLLSEEDLQPSIEVSAEVAPSEVTPDLLYHIQAMEPFGNANYAPLFASREVRALDIRRMGKEGDHLRLTVRAEGINGDGIVHCPWWGRGDMADSIEPGATLDVCYRPQFNDYRGKRSIQFLLEDIRAPEW